MSYMGISQDAKEKALRAYRALNYSGIQRRLRNEHRCDVGIRHWNPQIEDPESVRCELKRRIEPVVSRYRDHPALGAWPISGEPGPIGIPLRNDIEKLRFTRRLEAHYGSPEELNRRWIRGKEPSSYWLL